MSEQAGPRVLDDEPLTPMQRIAIRNMARSAAETVPVTVIQHARAEQLLAARNAYRATGCSQVTITSLVAHTLARALRRHSDVNAAIIDDRRVRYADVGLGLAVATSKGDLVVPVIARAQELPVVQLAAQISEVADAARAARLTVDQVRGGTFTLSSIGMVMPGGFGTAVIPPGQAGVLVAGGVTETPVARDGAVVAGLVLPLSLTFDHRVANGVALWAFFKDLIASIESIGGPEEGG